MIHILQIEILNIHLLNGKKIEMLKKSWSSQSALKLALIKQTVSI